MTRIKKAVTALGAFLALLMACTQEAGAASAATPQAHEDLLVSFTANVSVKIDGLQYSSRTVGALNAGVTHVPSSATVTNDSAGLTEKFQLHTLDASPAAISPLWGVGLTTGSTGLGTFCATNVGDPSCPGPDTYALQALFISSAAVAVCPAATSADWDVFKSTVASTTQMYTSAYFADTSATGTAGGGTGNPDQTGVGVDGNMFAVSGGTDGRGRRGLCVRLTMPSASSTVGQHTVRLTITAMIGS